MQWQKQIGVRLKERWLPLLNIRRELVQQYLVFSLDTKCSKSANMQSYVWNLGARPCFAANRCIQAPFRLEKTLAPTNQYPQLRSRYKGKFERLPRAKIRYVKCSKKLENEILVVCSVLTPIEAVWSVKHVVNSTSKSFTCSSIANTIIIIS